jgi:hypothetical protein
VQNGFSKNNDDSHREYERILTFEVSGFNCGIAQPSGILRVYAMMMARVVFMFGREAVLQCC